MRTKLDVACHNTHRGIGKERLEVMIFLIGEGLDGRGIEHTFSFL